MTQTSTTESMAISLVRHLIDLPLSTTATSIGLWLTSLVLFPDVSRGLQHGASAGHHLSPPWSPIFDKGAPPPNFELLPILEILRLKYPQEPGTMLSLGVGGPHPPSREYCTNN